MENKKDIWDELKKRQQADVPEGFFEHFSDDLMAKIGEQEAGLDQLKKSTKEEVPNGFFEEFSSSIMEKVEAQPPENKNRVIALKVMGFVSAVAACLLIMFYVMPEENTTVTADTNTELQEEGVSAQPIDFTEPLSDEEYITFLDGDDIVDFVLENEDILLESENNSLDELDEEDAYYYLEEDIDDLYYDEL